MRIELPDFVIADMYKNTLVITADAIKTPVQVTKNEPDKEPKTVQTEQKPRFLGANKRGIIIIVSDEHAMFINDEWLETLTKLLEALKINLADTAIINIQNYPVTVTLLKEELKARYVFMFGVTTQQIKLSFAIPDYQAQSYAGCVYMVAPAITLVSAANTTEKIKAEKRKLWESLKRISF